MVRFSELGHEYKSDDNTKWLSVTSCVKLFEEHFPPNYNFDALTPKVFTDQ